MRVEVDRDRCEGNAICVGIAPDLFDLDDETATRALARFAHRVAETGSAPVGSLELTWVRSHSCQRIFGSDGEDLPGGAAARGLQLHLIAHLRALRVVAPRFDARDAEASGGRSREPCCSATVRRAQRAGGAGVAARRAGARIRRRTAGRGPATEHASASPSGGGGRQARCRGRLPCCVRTEHGWRFRGREEGAG